MSAPVSEIRFRDYTRHVPPGIPVAIQAATRRLLASRARAVDQIPEWETLRQAAHDVRLETILRLDEHLDRLKSRITETGGHVHSARNAADACAIVVDIARQHGVKTCVKGKSMASEEIGLNHALEQAGVRPVETDVGEFIIQLAGIRPSHILGPATHMSKEEIAALFTEKLQVAAPPDPRQLTDIARAHLRREFLRAEMGITGANFLVAETGTLVLVTNEGNGRMCTTLPDIHVAVAGIDKIIPDWDALALLLTMLGRSATGQKMSCYTQFITGPRRPGNVQGPREFHLVLLDNGRSQIARDPVACETLLCIRCAACLNVCPVYNQVGGHAYGWAYSGPIGAILAPQLLGTRVARELPFASSLCGACADICPVKIPIPEILLHLRRRVVEGDSIAPASASRRVAILARAGTTALATPWLYRLGSQFAKWIQLPFRRNAWLPTLPPPLNRWTSVRPLPVFAGDFRTWWKTRPRPAGPLNNGPINNAPRFEKTAALSQADSQPNSPVPSASREMPQGMDRLLQEIRQLGGHAEHLNPDLLDRALQILVESEKIHVATLWADKDLAPLNLPDRLSRLGVRIVPYDADNSSLATCDLGVTGVDWALAESASLALRASPEKPRVTSLLPRVHLAIVRPTALCADLRDILSRIKTEPYAVLITGPSRTSDIESSPVLGAHGPKGLYVWAIE